MKKQKTWEDHVKIKPIPDTGVWKDYPDSYLNKNDNVKSANECVAHALTLLMLSSRSKHDWDLDNAVEKLMECQFWLGVYGRCEKLTEKKVKK